MTATCVNEEEWKSAFCTEACTKGFLGMKAPKRNAVNSSFAHSMRRNDRTMLMGKEQAAICHSTVLQTRPSLKGRDKEKTKTDAPRHKKIDK